MIVGVFVGLSWLWEMMGWIGCGVCRFGRRVELSLFSIAHRWGLSRPRIGWAGNSLLSRVSPRVRRVKCKSFNPSHGANVSRATGSRLLAGSSLRLYMKGRVC